MKKQIVSGQKVKTSLGDKTFDVINAIILIALCFVTLYPVWYVFCASMTSNSYLAANPGVLLFWPKGFNLGAYKLELTHPLLISGFKNILIIMGVALPINIVLTL